MKSCSSSTSWCSGPFILSCDSLVQVQLLLVTTPFVWRRGSSLTKPVNTHLHAWRGNRHCFTYLAGMPLAHMGWWGAASALLSVEQGKGDELAWSYTSHGYDFSPLCILTVGFFAPQLRSSFKVFVLGMYTCASHARILSWEAHRYVYGLPSFAVTRGVIKQLDRCESANMGWWSYLMEMMWLNFHGFYCYC